MSERKEKLLHVVTVPETLWLVGAGQMDYMKERGYEVAAACAPGDLVSLVEARDRIPVHTIPFTRRISPIKDFLALRQLIVILHRMRPDIVHAHTPKAGLLAMLAARWSRIPLRLYTLRGLPHETARGFKRLLLKTSERLSCSCAHRVFAQSHALREQAVREGLCPPGRIAVLADGGNGVDVKRFYPDVASSVRADLGIGKDAPVIGFAGRLVRDKGVHELASAWFKVRDSYPAARLLLVGPFEPRDAVHAIIRRRLEEDPRVHLPGRQLDMPAWYAAMNFVVIPTHREGLPNVPLEAAAMGKAVIASDIPACREAVVDGETGTLVLRGDTDALAQAITRYLDDPALANHHGDAGRRRVSEKFQPERVWEALLEEYERMYAEVRSK